jgi:hypothetical protein
MIQNVTCLIWGHSWENRVLILHLKWKTDEESFMTFTMVKQGFPYETAKYILQNKVLLHPNP